MLRILLIALAALLGLSQAQAQQCVLLTAANGGIGSAVPTALGPSHPSQSTWGAPVQPARQGSAANLGYNDDAIFTWTTPPDQVVSQNGGAWRVAIDGSAISPPTASTIKFAVNGGTLTSTLAYPAASPIGANGEACALVNLADLAPGRPFEVRAEICPQNGDCEELTSVRTLTMAANSSVAIAVAHGQIAGKFMAVTGSSSLPNYTVSSSGATETVTGVVCTAGPLTPNSMWLIPATVTRTMSGYGDSNYVASCASSAFSGFMNGNLLIVTSAVAGSTDLVAGALSPSSPGPGFGCVAKPAGTTCPTAASGPAAGAVGVYTMSATIGSAGFKASFTGTVSTVATNSAITACVTNNSSSCTPSPSGAYSDLIIASTSVTLHVGDNITGASIGCGAGSPPCILASQLSGAAGGPGTYSLLAANTAGAVASEAMNVAETTLSTSSATGLAVGQALGFSGETLSTTIASGSGTTWYLFANPGNAISVAMQTGTPLSMAAVKFLTAGASGDSFTLTDWVAGAHEQNPNGSDKGDNSLFAFYNPNNAPALTETNYVNPFGGDANPGTRASPMATPEAAIIAMTPTNSAQTGNGIQLAGTCLIGTTCPAGTVGANGAECLTLHSAGNHTGAIPFQANQPVLYDGRTGSVISHGPYFIDSIGTVSGVDDYLTLAVYAGGPCIDDTGVSGTTGNIWLKKDFSFSHVDLQCTNTPPTGTCPGPARFSYGAPTASPQRDTWISGLTIEPDAGVPSAPAGSTFFKYVGFNGTSVNASQFNVGNVWLKNLAVEYPVAAVPILNTIPAGTANPTLIVKTAALTIPINPTSQTNGTFIGGGNGCLPISFYGDPRTVINGGAAQVTSVTNNGDGTTSIGLGGNGSLNPLVAFATCPSGTTIKLFNAYSVGGSWRYWLDNVALYGDDYNEMLAGIPTTASQGGVGSGGGGWTNSVVAWAPGGLGGGNYNASFVINSSSFGIYTKSFEAVPVIVNSGSDMFSDSFNSFYTGPGAGASGQPNTYWLPLAATTPAGGTDFYIPAAQMPRNISAFWTVNYKCGTSAVQTVSRVDAWQLPAIGGTLGQASGAPPANSALVRVHDPLAANCPAYNGTTSLSAIWVYSASHEDCQQTNEPTTFVQSHYIHDGYRANAMCYGELLQLGNGVFDYGWMDSLFLDDAITGIFNYPYTTPGYNGAAFSGNIEYNMLVRGGILGIPSRNVSNFSVQSDFVFDGVQCFPSLGSTVASGYGAPSAWGVSGLSVINNPSSNGC